jgi:hypothetical protein
LLLLLLFLVLLLLLGCYWCSLVVAEVQSASQCGH